MVLLHCSKLGDMFSYEVNLSLELTSPLSLVIRPHPASMIHSIPSHCDTHHHHDACLDASFTVQSCIVLDQFCLRSCPIHPSDSDADTDSHSLDEREIVDT